MKKIFITSLITYLVSVFLTSIINTIGLDINYRLFDYILYFGIYVATISLSLMIFSGIIIYFRFK
jgi:hypothetical protein